MSHWSFSSICQLLAVTAPPFKATKCLESSFATAADVYVFWLAVQASFEELFKKNAIKLPPHVSEKILVHQLSNYCFNQTINGAPSDTFIVAFFLIPQTGYRDAASLKNINLPALAPICIHHSDLIASIDDNDILQHIGSFLVSQLQIEYKSKKQKIRSHDGNIALAELNRQILSYSKGAWPFNHPLSDDINIRKYWTNFLDHDNADILANKCPWPKPMVKFHDLDETIFCQAINGHGRKLETEASDESNGDSDAWLDDTTEPKDTDKEYQCCSSHEFVGGENACLDIPELLDLLSDKAINIGAQNQPQMAGPSSAMPGGDPIAWKFSVSQAS
ncbi:hypothetical protein M405DRAFT_868401 [Rhizopogon salebrosus TDB-379]|nr:hypothetical protein M405DRAFT_868401 [Rhizopogon salebrosus TDB-379]